MTGYRSQSVILSSLALGKLAHVKHIFELDLTLIFLELWIDTGNIVNFFESIEREYEYVGQPVKVESFGSLSLGLAVGTLPFIFDHFFLAVYLEAIFNAWLN